jgi:hypothetical protein
MTLRCRGCRIRDVNVGTLCSDCRLDPAKVESQAAWNDKRIWQGGGFWPVAYVVIILVLVLVGMPVLGGYWGDLWPTLWELLPL